MRTPSTDDDVKEVYARYGLAMFHAQVLEHGLVNALVILDLVPNRRARVESPTDWGAAVDTFMDRQFEKTMGRLIAALSKLPPKQPELEERLRDALARRNRLAHNFFRDHATDFNSVEGCDAMLADVDACRACFQTVDRELESVVAPLRLRAGITDEMLEGVYQGMVADSMQDE